MLTTWKSLNPWSNFRYILYLRLGQLFGDYDHNNMEHFCHWNLTRVNKIIDLVWQEQRGGVGGSGFDCEQGKIQMLCDAVTALLVF